MFNQIEKIENFTLELISTIVETKKPRTTIESVITILSKKGEGRLVVKLYGALSLIEDGRTYLESFFYTNMLTEDTYHLFKLADSKSALSKEVIQERIEDRISIQELNSATSSSLMQPFMLIFVASMASVFIVTRIVPVLVSLYKKQQTSFILEPYFAMNNHPFLGFLILVSLMFGSMGIIIILIKKRTGKTELDIYKTATVIKTLRAIGLNYDNIFIQLYEIETDKKLANLYYEICSLLTYKKLIDALDEIILKMPTDVAVVLTDKINSNDDIRGWEYTKRRMKAVTFNKIDAFSKTLPFISYVFILLVMLFAIVPIGFLAEKALSMVG